jgi:hypothetical protein
LVCFRSRAT